MTESICPLVWPMVSAHLKLLLCSPLRPSTTTLQSPLHWPDIGFGLNLIIYPYFFLKARCLDAFTFSHRASGRGTQDTPAVFQCLCQSNISLKLEENNSNSVFHKVLTSTLILKFIWDPMKRKLISSLSDFREFKKETATTSSCILHCSTPSLVLPLPGLACTPKYLAHLLDTLLTFFFSWFIWRVKRLPQNNKCAAVLQLDWPHLVSLEIWQCNLST